MNNFSWARALGFGALVWLIMFAVVSAFIGFNVAMSGIWLSVVFALFAGVVTYLVSPYLREATFSQALGYGTVFAAVGIALDFIISYAFNNQMFGAWTYWLGYALVLAAPMVYLWFHQGREVGNRRDVVT